MKLSVGAVSRRIVEEAARLQVHQIVASRAQVNEHRGYVGLDQFELVELVKRLSNGVTDVVRDHGGPGQGGFDDDGTASLRVDVEAGFDGLHLDVCKIEHPEQPATLRRLLERFAGEVAYVEVGGEHEAQEWNVMLLDLAIREVGVTPRYAVLDTGAHVWADSQIGQLKHAYTLSTGDHAAWYRSHNVGVKAHNFDWVGRRMRRYAGVLDAYNLAPELARVETDALLVALGSDASIELLRAAYKTGAWARWFDPNEGTWFDRARCAVHYVQERPEFRDLVRLTDSQDEWVRGVIWDAVTAG